MSISPHGVNAPPPILSLIVPQLRNVGLGRGSSTRATHLPALAHACESFHALCGGGGRLLHCRRCIFRGKQRKMYVQTRKINNKDFHIILLYVLVCHEPVNFYDTNIKHFFSFNKHIIKVLNTCGVHSTNSRRHSTLLLPDVKCVRVHKM